MGLELSSSAKAPARKPATLKRASHTVGVSDGLDCGETPQTGTKSSLLAGFPEREGEEMSIEIVLFGLVGLFTLIVLAVLCYMQWRLKKIARLLDRLAEVLKEDKNDT